MFFTVCVWLSQAQLQTCCMQQVLYIRCKKRGELGSWRRIRRRRRRRRHNKKTMEVVVYSSSCSQLAHMGSLSLKPTCLFCSKERQIEGPLGLVGPFVCYYYYGQQPMLMMGEVLCSKLDEELVVATRHVSPSPSPSPCMSKWQCSPNR
jgi:hypothetical protein